jgi:hypothetical protein
MTTLTNAQAALRWLTRPAPDLGEVREALASIVKDAVRAGDVVGRIRDLMKKTPPRKDLLDVLIWAAALPAVAITSIPPAIREHDLGIGAPRGLRTRPGASPSTQAQRRSPSTQAQRRPGRLAAAAASELWVDCGHSGRSGK